jgi:hypothetical protein
MPDEAPTEPPGPPSSPAASPVRTPPQLRASIYCEESLPPEFCDLAAQVERIVDAPLWLLIQNQPRDNSYGEISGKVYKGFQTEIGLHAPGDSLAVLLESPGGSPVSAFRIARLFQRRVKRFAVVVPQFAKSAATLLALGANQLVLGRDAELGPLDLQVFDLREERYESALNAVQSLERLGAHALSTVDQTMQLLMRRLPKTSDVLLPLALEYVATLLKPLFEKVDTIDYSRKSRDLKMAEEYAARLMRKQYGFARGRAIARKLVENYPAHGFVIDREEAMADDAPEDGLENAFGLGLKAVAAEPDLQKLFDRMLPFLDSITAIGRIEEASNA